MHFTGKADSEFSSAADEVLSSIRHFRSKFSGHEISIGLAESVKAITLDCKTLFAASSSCLKIDESLTACASIGASCQRIINSEEIKAINHGTYYTAELLTSIQQFQKALNSKTPTNRIKRVIWGDPCVKSNQQGMSYDPRFYNDYASEEMDAGQGAPSTHPMTAQDRVERYLQSLSEE